MPKTYSYDLRCKVIDAIELDGMRPSEASDYFHISRNTINLWRHLKTETGDLHPKPSLRSGHSHKITDWEKFRAFAHKHRYKTQAHMAQLWDGHISERTISRALRKIGGTRKKRPMATANAMNKNWLIHNTARNGKPRRCLVCR